jgi:hypothetical protein
MAQRLRIPAAAAGFSLMELMLSLSLGLALSGAMLQGLMAEGHTSLRLSRLFRERAYQRRTLELLKTDLRRATAVSADPIGALPRPAECSLAGRLPVLHLTTGEGVVLYAVGAAPSGIWRGQVLMRCGPAFGLDGEIAPGSSVQNRVVLDGLASKPKPWAGCQALLASASEPPHDLAGSSSRAFSACLDPGTGLVAVRLQQEFPAAGGRLQTITSESLLGSGG